MATTSIFRERLQQMEETRNQRLDLLRVEKELQSAKSQLLREKLSNLRRMEQRCLLMEMRSAELGFRILAKKSEIDALDSRHRAAARDFMLIRVLKGEIDETKGREKERDRFYEMRISEMEEFKGQVSKRLLDSRSELQDLRNSVSELRSFLTGLQSNDVYLNNPQITAAETRKAELLASKEDLDKNLSSNYRLRSMLQKQLHKMLISQGKEGAQ